MNLRPYQIELSNKANSILKRGKLVCLCFEVRTGKTLTALQTAQNFGAKNVLFVTKINAFSSVKMDYCVFWFFFCQPDQSIIQFINACRTWKIKDDAISKKIEDKKDPTFENYRNSQDAFKLKFKVVTFENIYKIQFINIQSLHKINDSFDLMVYDEFHQFATYPKQNTYQKFARAKYSKLPMILLSGTPTPESYSQWFHSLQLSDYSPFKQYSNFYKWAKDFVNVKQIIINGLPKNDYRDADKSKIYKYIDDIVLTYTQAEAGFVSTVEEVVLEVEMQEITKLIVRKLKQNKIVQNREGNVILGDTAVKLMQKEHQLWSGTCKFEDGTSKTIDTTKAMFIQNYFKGKKIAIYYKFKEELIMLQNQFGTKLTTDLDEFNATNKNIALQFVSGREGLSLRNADYIVALNIDFSATTYFQFKDRMTTMERKENTIYWVFSKGGIEHKIYKSVQAKKNFTLSVYLK